uniref:Uncharacterized protein n=1 Tax=Timema douglasi TaxID=61478 RepID=A0A7R8VU82_TIMDO|nr:unnamed protein product [Timema douglasi]
MEELQFNVGSEPQWTPGIPHIYKFLLIHDLSEVKGGFGNQINLIQDRGLNPGPQTLGYHSVKSLYMCVTLGRAADRDG